MEEKETAMVWEERIRQAAGIWLSVEIFAEQEGKTFEEKMGDPGVVTKDGETQLVGEDEAPKEGATIQTFEEKLREYDVTEAEIRKYFEEQDNYDPTDEPWNSEDTKVMLGWLGAIAAVIVVIVVLIVVF
ncbi:MAG: hypothetical protein ACREXR_24190 [Gammaproteobacteria bacterium]